MSVSWTSRPREQGRGTVYGSEGELVSDQDFNFAPPPPRRERKDFEPPPWEKHLFEQLAKEQEQKQEPVEPAEPLPTPEAEPVVEEPSAVVDSSATGDDESDEGPRIDEVQLAAMMFELRAEEVPATQMYARATLVAGAVLLLIGIVMVIWSFVMIMVALRRADQGRTGVFVGMTVLVFGAGFAGTGAWFMFKTLRQQGVL
jgi:hypothetical protein